MIKCSQDKPKVSLYIRINLEQSSRSMGSILQFFDLNQANSSRKLVAHKRRTEGHEAPRNGLEFRNGTSHNYNLIQEDIPYSCQVKKHSKINYRSNDTLMKRLIEEEPLKSKCNAPSVVARLMGMDDLPSETKPTIHANKWKDEKRGSSLPRNKATRLSPKHHASFFGSSSTLKRKRDYAHCNTMKESIESTNSLKLVKPQLLEHPQEEILQKFEKDFEAWQTSKVWEHSRTCEIDKLRQAKVNQILAQENLNREKMARYWESRGCATNKKATKPKSNVSQHQPKTIVEQRVIFSPERNIIRQKQDGSSSPTNIVILRPSVEGSEDVEGPWSASPELLGKEANMQDFLEEVNERLKCENLGKARNNTTSRYFNTETYFDERPGNTKHFARHIAKQIRENVTRDLGTSLICSESTRLCRSKFQVNGPEFPEFINRNTRKLLSERLENVMRNETDAEVPLAPSSKLTMKQVRVKSQSMHEFSKLEEKSGYWEDKRPLTESKVFDSKPASPRNLMRTFSAPVSGTAFAKLLLEDQHVLTGARIHHKHEASENSFPESRRKKKDGVNLKGTVSTLKQNFTLKGKLFGKKTYSVNESASNELDSMDALVTSSSIATKASNVQDNSTEVPPSPASVSSSSLDEFCRPGFPSPVSPLLGPFIEDQLAAETPTESCSILSETRNLSHVEHGGFDEVSVEDKTCTDEAVEVEGHAQAYIREILITSGLYEGEVPDEAFPNWDAAKKPIPKWVFDQVVETYTQNDKFDECGSLFCYGDTYISRKLLFDLTNEALPRVLKPTINSTFKKWLLSPNKTPNRKKLLNDLWREVRVYINSNPNKSDIAVHDVLMRPWCSILHEDLYITGKKLELAMLEDLIDELLLEMK